MPQSLARVIVHAVFSTKNREPLTANEFRDQLYDYLGGTLGALRCPVIQVGGVMDHVHLLYVLSRTLSISKVMEEVKKESSKWAKGLVHPNFFWQTGYAAFSVSPSNITRVAAYIANQEKHQLKLGFQDEFRELLRRHKVEWDERYVWD